MAESQQEPSQEQGVPAVAINLVQRDGEAAQDDSLLSYWCYQCNKEVSAENPNREDAQGTVPAEMVCIECQSGFIEAMATARPDLDQILHRRRRRTAAQGRTVSLLDVLEHLYPQQLMDILQMLDQTTHPTDTRVSSQESVGLDIENEPESLLRHMGADILDEGHSETVPDEINGSSLSLIDSATNEGHPRGARERSVDRQAHAESGADTDSGTEGVRFEFEGWDSAEGEEDDEWEEVEDGDDVAGSARDVTEIEVVEETEIEVMEDSRADTLADQRTQGQDQRHPLLRELHNLRFRARNMEENLQEYLQRLIHNLGGQNIEVRVELPDNTTYVGDPRDYVDAREFELLLQQFAENDNSRRGAPPAAKTAVDGLPSIIIQQFHIANGASVCAICKECLCAGESGKQLPCLHFYHQECILPWLSSRNSCPVCRFELPTDDPDYEEQKKTECLRMRSSEAVTASADQGDEGITIPLLPTDANATHLGSERIDSEPSSSGENSGSTSSDVNFEVLGKRESSTIAEHDISRCL